MSPRPDSDFYQSVDNTFSLEDLSASARDSELASVLDEGPGSATLNLEDDRTQTPVVPDRGGRTNFRTRVNDVYLLAGIFIMLLWPWILLTTIWLKGGIQMSDNIARVVNKHPQRTNYSITLFASIINIAVGILFSGAVVRFSLEWGKNNDHLTVFDVSLISAFRNQHWPWGIKDHKYLLIQKRWLPAVLAGVCIVAFAVVPSGTTSLITPVPFQKIWNLTGTELDFSANLDNCLNCTFTNILPQVEDGECSWNSPSDARYQSCDDLLQLANTILESGRSSILSLFSNNSETVFFGELSSHFSRCFLGPTRGILPVGPNTIPGFDTLQHSPLPNDTGINTAILSYNYTLKQQGVTTNISCIYDIQSPIAYSAEPRDDYLNITGSCDESGLHDPLVHPASYRILKTNSTLAFWACYSPQDQASYIYLRGYGSIYEIEVGNISCRSQIQPAVFPVTYQTSTNLFSTQEPVADSAPRSKFFSDFVTSAMASLFHLVVMVQNPLNNPIYKSVKNLGIQTLWLQPPNEQYLPLFQAMIQGMMMEMITHLRIIHSMETLDTPPASCIRTVNGMVSAEVTGWFAKPIHIAFLMPMTILNLASLILMLVSIVAKAKRSPHEFDPTDPRSLVLAESRLNESEPSGWSDGVSYHSRELVMFQRSANNARECAQCQIKNGSVPSSSPSPVPL